MDNDIVFEDPPVSETERLGRCLRQARGGRGLRESAREAGLSPSALCGYEKGRNNPSLTAALRLAAVYGIGLDELVGIRADR